MFNHLKSNLYIIFTCGIFNRNYQSNYWLDDEFVSFGDLWLPGSYGKRQMQNDRKALNHDLQISYKELIKNGKEKSKVSS